MGRWLLLLLVGCASAPRPVLTTTVQASSYAQALQKAKQLNAPVLVVVGEIEIDLPGFVRVDLPPGDARFGRGELPRVFVVEDDRPVLKWVGALPKPLIDEILRRRPAALAAWARGDTSGLRGDPILVRAGQAADVEAGRRDRCAAASARGEIGAFVGAAAIACGGSPDIDQAISAEAKSHVYFALARAGKSGFAEPWAKAIASMPRVPLSMGEHVTVLIERFGEDRFLPILEEHAQAAPSPPRWLRVARAAFAAGDRARARAWAEKAMPGSTGFDAVRAKAIFALSLDGERDRAKALLKEAVEAARALPLEAEEAIFRARLEVRLAEWR